MAPAAPAAPGPADCAVPGYDDECEAWTAPRYDGPWGGWDEPGMGAFWRHTTTLAHPTKDLLFVGGTSSYIRGDFYDSEFVQVAYRASTGQPVWTSVYPGLDELTYAYETSIALSPEGDTLFAIGEAADPISGSWDYNTIIAAFSTKTGHLLWGRRAPIVAQAIETSIMTLADGTVHERIYLAGISGGASPNGNPVAAASVAALDASDGRELWTTGVPGQTDHGSRFNELAVSSDGSTIYAGGGEHREDRLARNFLTASFQAVDGATLWAARDELTQPEGFYGNNGASDLKVTPDGGRVIISGFDPDDSQGASAPSVSPILTIAHDGKTGEVAWRKSFGASAFNLFQEMMGMSPDGRTLVAIGRMGDWTGIVAVAYDVATGTQKWGVEATDQGSVKVGSGGVNSSEVSSTLGYYPSVVVSNDAAFISYKRGFGVSQTRTVTEKYALDDGVLEWTARLGTGRTLFAGNALAPDGKTVFVTASDKTYTSPTYEVADPDLDSTDILTVAYGA